MKWILTTVMMMAVTIGTKAQYVTYNHDSPKMNQITVGETGAGALKPELYYTLLHNKYKKTAAVKNKLAFRTTAGVASYQQVDEAEAIDSALTSRAKIEALNVADRQVDLAWLAEEHRPHIADRRLTKRERTLERLLPGISMRHQSDKGCLYAQCRAKATISANLCRCLQAE